MRRDRLGLVLTSWRLSCSRATAGLATLAAVASGVACGSSSAPPSGEGNMADGSLAAEGGPTGEPDAAEPGPDATIADSAAPDSTVVGASADATTDAATDAAVTDAHPADDAPSDGASGDGSGGGDAEAGAAAPTLWLAGASSLSLYGITSDNYVIYYDGSVRTFFAQPVGGGSPIAIYVLPGSLETTAPVIIGKTVFIYTFASNNVRVGPILAWSSSLAAAVPLGSTGI